MKQPGSGSQQDGRGRRGHGAGGIQQRGPDTYRLWFDAPAGSNGERRRRSETFHGTKTGAQQRLREILSRIDRAEYVERTKETVGEFLQRWLDVQAAPNVSPRTMRDYRGVVKRYLVPNIGAVPLAKLRPDQVQALYADLSARGLSGNTVLHVHRLLSEALERAVKWQLILRNPCRAVDAPRARRTEMRALDRTRLDAFFAAIESSRYRDVYAMGLYSGLRRSEILGLRWPQVNTEAAAVRVIAGLHRLEGQGLVLLPTKTATSRRTVDLPSQAVELLHEVRARQMLQATQYGVPWTGEGYVFCTAEGRPFWPENVSHDFHERMKTAGLSGLRLHDLRHSFASLMLAAGVEPKKVQAALGHSSIMVTMDIYGHLMPGAGKEAAARFAEYLGSR